MREITLVLDEGLYETIEDYANDTGFSFNKVIIQALSYWFHDIDPDACMMAELSVTEAEWRQLWGMDANAVVHNLRAQRKTEANAARREELAEARRE